MLSSGNDEYQMVFTLQNDRFLVARTRDHLFNNLASNLVHVVSNSESDNLQIVKLFFGGCCHLQLF